MPRILVSTAEASAERHASHVVTALRLRVPGIGIDAAAGSGELAEAGAEIIVDMRNRAVMGFWEAVRQYGFYRHAGKRILAALEGGRHDALVLVDAPSFHLPVAKLARRRFPGLPILCYIAPKLWAWKEWRVKNLRRDFDRTLCIFPFEVDFFRRRGVDAVYVGNPTLDQIRRVSARRPTRAFAPDGSDPHEEASRGTLAVFPGSRGMELKHIWPRMAKAIRLLSARFPHLRIAVALAPNIEEATLAAHAPLPDGVEFVRRNSQELIAASVAVLAKSGTTTLEAALLGKPMAICYATDRLSAAIVRRAVKLDWVGLPNILAGKGIVREFLQEECTPENLAGEIGELLTNPEYYTMMRSGLSALRHSLGDEPAADRTAREIESFLGNGKHA